MIDISHVILPSPEQMQFIIEGMRNPMNSWDRSDSGICKGNGVGCENCSDISECDHEFDHSYHIGVNDKKLMRRLSNAGTEHRKFMRMMPVYARITAPLYWWKEFDTYKVGTVANSCSTMHKIHAKEFTIDDFSHEYIPEETLEPIIGRLNVLRTFFNVMDGEEAKIYWYEMIQLLPSSYNQTRNVMMNYEVLSNIYNQRHRHKLTEWRTFCDWIKTIPNKDIILGDINMIGED